MIKEFRDATEAESAASTDQYARVCCIIPSYKCAQTVCGVVTDVLRYVDEVIVVDDGCPEGSGKTVLAQFGNDAVHVVTLTHNAGVGAAMKAGIEEALRLGADVIVKIDADGQMDPSYIPRMAELLCADPDLCLVKGNRFTKESVLRQMPALRLFGNSALSLLVRFASGYWDMLDPTNGYLAFNAHFLQLIGWKKFSDRYFFETSVLCAAGLKKAKIAEVEMPAIYAGEQSSLSISRSALEFPPKLMLRFLQRILLQYFVFDVNVASIYLLLGSALCGFGLGFGCYEWIQTVASGIPRTTGTVMLAVLPILMGFQLLLNSLLYDVQFAPKVYREPLAWMRNRGKRYARATNADRWDSGAHRG